MPARVITQHIVHGLLPALGYIRSLGDVVRPLPLIVEPTDQRRKHILLRRGVGHLHQDLTRIKADAGQWCDTARAGP